MINSIKIELPSFKDFRSGRVKNLFRDPHLECIKEVGDIYWITEKSSHYFGTILYVNFPVVCYSDISSGTIGRSKYHQLKKDFGFKEVLKVISTKENIIDEKIQILLDSLAVYIDDDTTIHVQRFFGRKDSRINEMFRNRISERYNIIEVENHTRYQSFKISKK